MINRIEKKRVATRGSREPVQNIRYPERRRELGQQFFPALFLEIKESDGMENVFDQRSNRIPFPLLNPPQSPTDKGPFGFIKWIFSMTDEERVRAGIYVGNQAHDLAEASTLIIPDLHYE